MSTDPFDTPADPFDLPAFDPETGELLGDEEEPTGAALAPVDLASAAVLAIESVDHEQVAAFTGDLRAALQTRRDALYQALLDRRPEGRPTPESVAPELTWLADVHDVFTAVGKVFTEQARDAKSLAGDVVLEVRTDRDVEASGGSASVRVGVPGSRRGNAVKVTATQPTETFANTPAIVAVLVPYLLEREVSAGMPGSEAVEDAPEAYAAGARDMARVLLGLAGHHGLLSSPGWKSSALDVLRGELQSMGEAGNDLAARLREAYGRRPKGNLRVEVERSNLLDADG